MTDRIGDLYPFLGQEDTDPRPVLADVRRSTLLKSEEIVALRGDTWEAHAADLTRAAHLIARCARADGKILAFGNGGSATDAQDVVHDALHPPRPDWRPISALDLTRDIATITAVGNDVGFESVFARQVLAFGQRGDVAIGFSTSGESANVIEAFARARERRAWTIGFSGDRGGRMAQAGLLDVCIVAPSTHIPRIQEAHATAWHSILEMAQMILQGS